MGQWTPPTRGRPESGGGGGGARGGGEIDERVVSGTEKTGQEEKGVATVTRGWEEFKNKFPYLAHTWRLKLSSRSFKAEMKLSDEELERKDRERERWANKHEVKKWLSWVVSRRCFIED